ncbi:MAG: beta-lactamase family protein [Gemmatimonadetes bacterium]|nr:beta-lactamase family protein [Gemmatimonadota bacterium]
MILRTILTSSGLIAIIAASAGAQELPIARIDSVFQDLNRSDRPGCTIAVFKGGEVAYANGYGMANLEYGIALQPRSVFHVASISKQFTAFAVELLVSEGRVSWDDPIQDYVPEIPQYGQPVTLRHLAHHISGIRDQWSLLIMAGWRWQADLVTQADAIEIMSRQTALNFEPGAEYLYSNSGFTLLAAVVERVTGQTLKEFSQDRIFSPLGMSSTHFHDDHETIVPDRAYGYRHFDDEGWKISIPDFAIVGASSLFTTVEDMARWDTNLRDHTLGDEALYKRFFDRGILKNGDSLNYAHGIVVGSYRGQRTVGHGGADAGYRTSYLRFTGLDVGIVSFCNFARANPGSYVRQVADIVLEGALDEVEETNNQPPEVDTGRWAETFMALQGFYRDPRRDRPVHVWIHEGLARATQGFGRDDSGLLVVPVGDHRFHLWPGNDTATIAMGNGHAASIEMGGIRSDYIGPAVTNVDPAPYLGTYWSEELGTEYRVEADTGNADIALVHRKQDTDRFRAAFEDGFWSGGDWLTFERDSRGRVVGFTWSNGRVRKVKFVRRP